MMTFTEALAERGYTTMLLSLQTGFDYMTIASWRAGHRRPGDSARVILSRKLKVERELLDSWLDNTRKRWVRRKKKSLQEQP